MAQTAKVIILKGNPKKPESAEHIIKFPGGSVSVTRTSDNEYWAHIEVNKQDVIDEAIRESALGTIVESRLDYDWPSEYVKKIPNHEKLNHVAIRIKI